MFFFIQRQVETSVRKVSNWKKVKNSRKVTREYQRLENVTYMHTWGYNMNVYRAIGIGIRLSCVGVGGVFWCFLRFLLNFPHAKVCRWESGWVGMSGDVLGMFGWGLVCVGVSVVGVWGG